MKILLISYFAPSRGHAGGLRLLDIYANIKKINPEIRLVLITCAHPNIDWGIEDLDFIFNEIHWLPPESYTPKAMDFRKIEKNCEIIDLQYHQSGELIGVIRKNFPSSTIIFSPMESQIRALFIILKNISDNSICRRWTSHFFWLFKN